MSEYFVNFLINPGIILLFTYFVSCMMAERFLRFFLLIAPIFSFAALIMHFQNTYTYWMAFSLLVSLWSGLLFAFQRSKTSTSQLALLYFGAGIAIVLASNLMIVFILLEVMLVAATFIIFNGANSSSSVSGINYFKFHIFSGILFLIASLSYFSQYGSFEIDESIIYSSNFFKLVMLVSLLINLAMPPFSYWLVSGYASSSPTGTIFLSIGVTKVTLILLLKMFLGYQVLIYFGLVMAVYGIIYSVLETDVRRNFNYSIICQIGLILLAIGVGGDLGQKAAIFMIISEVIYIALAAMCLALFFSGELRNSKVVFLAILVAFASIASLPLSPGYIGKFLLYSTPEIMNNIILKYSITLITIGVIFSTAIKIPFVVLTNSRIADHSISLPMTKRLAILLLIVAILILGIFPGIIIEHDFYFSLRDYLYKFLMFLSVLVLFLLFAKKMVMNSDRKLINEDWFYRVLIRLYNKTANVTMLLIKNMTVSFSKYQYVNLTVLDKISIKFQYQLLIIILGLLGWLIIL
jgi:multicomponent Na+:H+ antiporter subunit D